MSACSPTRALSKEGKKGPQYNAIWSMHAHSSRELRACVSSH